MNYKVLSISLLVCVAGACTTETTTKPEDHKPVAEQREDKDRMRELILTAEKRKAPNESYSTDEIVISTAPSNPEPQGKQDPQEHSRQDPEQNANTPETVLVSGEREQDMLRSYAGQEVARTELTARHVMGDAAISTFVNPPASTAIAQVAGRDIRHASEPLYRENYQRPEDYRVMRVAESPVSTFSIDVDTGAYTNARRWLNQGQLPPEDAVRVEEFINYFDYDYPKPKSHKQPFLAETEIAPTPWNSKTHLLRVGIQGYEVPRHQLPATNLVFLVDVSGSMQSPDKLPLLKQALGMLTRQLTAHDCISLVVYAGASGVVLPPTSGNQKALILNALNQLEAGGSTNGAAGIELAYQMAQQKFNRNGVNRVILATDGDFNVGLASTTELIDMIQRKRSEGIALTTLGFGTGNYNDHLLEQLADEGNGNYAYIDRLSEAQKVLNQELSSTLLTIAKDVKIQIEFNPNTVSEYRLIGYENRHLNEEDFSNDKIDAGEIGAGHRVTAIYEISLAETGYQRLPDRRYGGSTDGNRSAAPSLENELAHLRIRYKKPDEDTSRLIQAPVMRESILGSLKQASQNFRFAAAVAAFGQKLRGGQYLEAMDYPQIAELASHARGDDRYGYRSEFVQLVALAEALDGRNSYAQDETDR